MGPFHLEIIMDLEYKMYRPKDMYLSIPSINSLGDCVCNTICVQEKQEENKMDMNYEQIRYARDRAYDFYSEKREELDKLYRKDGYADAQKKLDDAFASTSDELKLGKPEDRLSILKAFQALQIQ